MKLERRSAIVTGGSQGLGRAIVAAFLKEGANVLFCARTAADVGLAEAALRPGLAPDQILLPCVADVTKPEAIVELVDNAILNLGQIHAIVNNAGIYGPIGPSEEVDWEEWVRAMEINLFGAFRLCRQIIPHFKAHRYGKIINISGGGATNPLPRFSAYAASKAALVRLTETLAEELREFNIDANAVAPGALKTRLIDEVLKAGADRAGASFYARNQKWAAEGGTPLELGASLCVYLASGESDGVTGKLLSAQWDPWPQLQDYRSDLDGSDIYTLRRIVPKDRGKDWGG